MTRDTDAENEMRSVLDPGENLLWAGRPRQGVTFYGTDLIVVPFSLLWLGFMIGVLVLLVTSEAEIHGSAIAIYSILGFFIVIGLQFVFGRFWLDVLRRRNTTYGITNNRVIIQSGLFRRRLKSLNLRTLSDITLREKRNGSGTIALGPQKMFDNLYRNAPWPGISPSSQAFEGVKEARQVFNTLRQAQMDS